MHRRHALASTATHAHSCRKAASTATCATAFVPQNTPCVTAYKSTNVTPGLLPAHPNYMPAHTNYNQHRQSHGGTSMTVCKLTPCKMAYRDVDLVWQDTGAVGTSLLTSLPNSQNQQETNTMFPMRFLMASGSTPHRAAQMKHVQTSTRTQHKSKSLI
jgi:hypothetical protein